jgi:hypothetical protein
MCLSTNRDFEMELGVIIVRGWKGRNEIIATLLSMEWNGGPAVL